MIDGPAEQGLDRANWTHEELADHLLKTKGIRTSGKSAVQRVLGRGIGIRPYRPTYRSSAGRPGQAGAGPEEIAELGNGRRPVNSSC